ncbi:hypothetical protein [Halalkalibacter lacteus]|uniref:hypothetical protein n=1 Tax=Halalkalibacter lacteus TaxID=3090663 RepID=UPI002FC96981
MSDYQQFLSEREKVDYLLEKGYQIDSVTENFNGSYVDFSLKTSENLKDTVQLHIQTVEARKYFSTKLMIQQSR